MQPDLSAVTHNKTLEELVDIICTKTGNQERGFFRVEVAYFFAKMAASMGAKIHDVTLNETFPVNLYALNMAISGYGKGHSMHIMEKQVINRFRLRFTNETLPLLAEQNLWKIANQRAAMKSSDQQEEFTKTEKEYLKLGNLPFTFDSATTPAVKKLRQKILRADCGSINLQIDEIGSNLISNTEILTLFLELFEQGEVNQKLTMNTAENQHIEELEGCTPTNVLMFGTPAKLLDGGPIEEQFHSFMDTGYGRRCFYGYGQEILNGDQETLTPEQAYRLRGDAKKQDGLKKWANHFYQLADAVNYGWTMTIEPEVGIAKQAYEMHCKARARNMREHESVRKAEMEHRHSKAIKLAGAFAFIEGSTEIEMDHLNSAIKMAEESGQAFEKLLNREKPYVKLAKYIADIATEVTHADLHEALPFYKMSQAARSEMMTMAIAWGYKKHIIIKKSFIDGIEFFQGETLQETDLNKMIVSYSNHWAYNYLPETVPFHQLHILTQKEGMHWTNHHFKGEHRAGENAIPGFNMIVLDVDEGITVQAACELMKDFKFLVYTTKRHQKEGHGDRFRMILPINYMLELTSEEYIEFMEGIFKWLPFKTDEEYRKREKKSESYAGGSYFYNLEAEVFDALDFIPKTSRNEAFIQQNQELASLDNLERWFAQRIAEGNRNNQMIKYALVLVDSGWDLIDVNRQVRAFNAKLSNPLTEQELDSTIMVTVAKRYQQTA